MISLRAHLKQTAQKIINSTASLVLVTASLGGFAPFFMSGSAAAAGLTTVSTASTNGWYGLDDNGKGGSLGYVTGPAGTGSLGFGSVQLSTTGTQGYMLAKNSYGGTKLSSITSLSYQTNVKTGNNTIAPALQFDIDKDTTDTNVSWQGRLVYEPYMNGTVTDNTWQTWNAKNGKWWLTKANLFAGNCSQSSPCTFAQLTSLFPNMGINMSALIGFKAGNWNGTTFVGNVDNLKFNNDTYDFEPTITTPTNFKMLDNTHNNYALQAPGFVNIARSDSTKFDLTWNAVPGANHYITTTYLNGSKVGTAAYTGTPNAWVGGTTGFAAFGDGTYTFTTCAYGGGNVSGPCATTDAYVVDTTAPTLAGVTANARSLDLQSTTTVNGQSGITLSATCDDNLSSSQRAWITFGQWTPTSDNRISGYTIFIPADKLSDGQTYQVTVECSDLYHYTVYNQAQTTVSFKVDNTAPAMLLRQGENGSVIASGSVFNNAGKNIRIDKDNTDTIHVTKPDGSTWIGGKKDASYAGGKLSMGFLFTQQGTYTFYTEDEAGNDSANYTITIDSLLPAIQDVTLDRTLTNSDTLVVNGTVTDANLSYYRCNVYDSTNYTGLNALLGANGYYTQYTANVTNGQLCTVPIKKLADGTYNVRVVAYDKATNANANSYTGYSFTIDRTAPTLSNVKFSKTGTSYITNPAGIYVTFTADEPLSGLPTVQFDGVAAQKIASLGNNKYAAYSYYSNGNLPDGPVSLTIEYSDPAGNAGTTVSNTSDGSAVVIDSTAPTVTIDKLATSTPTPTLTGTIGDATPTSVTVKVDGQEYAAIVNGTSWTSNITTALAPGTYDVVAVATDAAGNTSLDTTTSELTIQSITLDKTDSKTIKPLTLTLSTGGNHASTLGSTSRSSDTLSTGTITTDDNNANTDSNNKSVKGAETKLNTKSDTVSDAASKNFLGLGWWWLLVILAALALIYGIFRARSQENA
jgi:hypothetical protein